MNKIFDGVATALYTPFNDTGIDFEQFERQIDRQLSAKVNALVFLGTTGESSTVERFERRKIISFAVSKLKGRIPIIVGTGSNCTKTACDMTSEAKELGADASLIVTPYYNRCEQDGLILHYEEISKKCKFPFIAYNVPKRTGVNILPTTAKAILKNPYAFGLKEANGDLNHVKKTFEEVDFISPIYCGSDQLTTEFLKLKGFGSISVASNVIPFKMQEFISDFLTNYEKHNNDYTLFFKDFFNLLETKVNPITIKCLGKIIYGEECKFRLPLSNPDSAYYEYLEQSLNKLCTLENLR